jgi:RNA polymerase sigma-70 factor (ECF subfamily)
MLFQKYREIFFNLAYKSLGPGFDIDEVVHEIFIQVFKGLASFKGKSSFDTWVYRIGLNVCLSNLRKKFKKRKLDIVPGYNEIENIPSDSIKGPSEELEKKELETKIFESLEKIDNKKRMIIVMHDMEGKTLEEIAKIMKKPIGTIKSRLFHGRNEMKKYLQKYLKS